MISVLDKLEAKLSDVACLDLPTCVHALSHAATQPALSFHAGEQDMSAISASVCTTLACCRAQMLPMLLGCYFQARLNIPCIASRHCNSRPAVDCSLSSIDAGHLDVLACAFLYAINHLRPKHASKSTFNCMTIYPQCMFYSCRTHRVSDASQLNSHLQP